MDTAGVADLEALHRHLDERPDDWDTRLVLADLYEDLGDPDRACLQRWLVRHKKRPHPPLKGNKPSWLRHLYQMCGHDKARQWSWWSWGIHDVPSVLGCKTYRQIFGGDPRDGSAPERILAEESLVGYLKKNGWDTAPVDDKHP